VYRRFDDTGDDEEEIDPNDLGMLQQSTDASAIVKPLKTLTRRSIRPRRLFQTEQQKRTREAEKEEEAATDIEEESELKELDHRVPELHVSETESEKRSTQPRKIRSLRSATKGAKRTLDEDDEVEEDTASKKKSKKVSPFDSWPRVKAGTRSATSTTTKGKKRNAAEALDSE